jgi:hypothetical protein
MSTLFIIFRKFILSRRYFSFCKPENLDDDNIPYNGEFILAVVEFKVVALFFFEEIIVKDDEGINHFSYGIRRGFIH